MIQVQTTSLVHTVLFTGPKLISKICLADPCVHLVTWDYDPLDESGVLGGGVTQNAWRTGAVLL